MADESASSPVPAEGAVPLDRLLADSAARLAAAGIDDPKREARLLLAHAIGLTQDDLLRLPRAHPIDPTRLHLLLARRAAREPLAFITGARGFWTLDLLVDPSTLIPRPDTETLIEAALALRPDRAPVARILDLGCGTGALLLAALTEYRAAFGIGIDRGEPACCLSRANAARHDLSARAAFVCADWTAALAPKPGFDLILCNPPYIETAALPGLMPEVSHHEPSTALDGGPDGLTAYRSLLPALPPLLSPGGLAILELGAGQSAPVIALAAASGLAVRALRPDLSGVARALCLERDPSNIAKMVGSRSMLG